MTRNLSLTVSADLKGGGHAGFVVDNNIKLVTVADRELELDSCYPRIGTESESKGRSVRYGGRTPREPFRRLLLVHGAWWGGGSTTVHV